MSASDALPHWILPPEIIALVIEHLRDSKPDLLTCSLVSRGWLPFARGNLEISIVPASSPAFITLLASPANTFGTTLRRLHIHSSGHGALLPLLATFTSLRSLSLFWTNTSELPALPSLTELRLFSPQFPSYSSFVTFMSELPALQRLRLYDVLWPTNPDDDQHTFPPFELLSLELIRGRRPLEDRIVFALRTRKLILGFAHQVPSPFLSMLSIYLHYLGPGLKSLELLDCGRDLGQYSNLCFRYIC